MNLHETDDNLGLTFQQWKCPKETENIDCAYINWSCFSESKTFKKRLAKQNSKMTFVQFEPETCQQVPMLLKSQSPSMCDGMDLDEFFTFDSLSDEEDDWHR